MLRHAASPSSVAPLYLDRLTRKHRPASSPGRPGACSQPESSISAGKLPAAVRRLELTAGASIEVHVTGHERDERECKRVDDACDDVQQRERHVRKEDQRHSEEWSGRESNPRADTDERPDSNPASPDETGAPPQRRPGRPSSSSTTGREEAPTDGEPDGDRDQEAVAVRATQAMTNSATERRSGRILRNAICRRA